MVQEGSMVVTRTLADQLRVTVNPEVEVHPQVLELLLLLLLCTVV
jgi:hypothetical protein